MVDPFHIYVVEELGTYSILLREFVKKTNIVCQSYNKKWFTTWESAPKI